LTARGQARSQFFDILKDPRLTSTAEDFQEQFDLLIQIRDRVTEAHDGASQILSLRKQLETAGRQTEEDKLDEAIIALDGKLTEILNELVELRFRGIDDQMLVYPLKLNVAIASLQRAVASADRSPTEQTYTVFRQRSAELVSQLEKLATIVNDDIPALNQLLRGAGISEISVNP
jgi:hypothetical protein